MGSKFINRGSRPNYEMKLYRISEFTALYGRKLSRWLKKNEVREEYSRKDLGAGTRGKYSDDYREGTNIVILDPDVAKAFPDSKSVNQALREYLQRRSG